MTTISDADLILYIVDGTCALNDDDYRIMDALHGKKVITLINKNDQNLVVDKLGITSTKPVWVNKGHLSRRRKL